MSSNKTHTLAYLISGILLSTQAVAQMTPELGFDSVGRGAPIADARKRD